jgi:hypothetical protein
MIHDFTRRLEAYSIRHPQEVLQVTLEIGGERDEILIFKGFSSSLVRTTASDPDVPVFPDQATIINIDRLQSPYRPAKPVYIQQGLTRELMEELLATVGV